MRKGFILLAVLAIGLAAFLCLDFRLATSGNHVSSQVASGSNAGAREALRSGAGATLYLHVEGGDALAKSLEAGLVRHPALRRYFTNVERVGDPDVVKDGSVLVVEPVERGVRWTPVFGKATVAATVAFSSNGDLSWRDGGAFRFTSGEPAVMSEGTYTITDETAGLLSLPAYEAHLGERLAEAIGKSLGEELERKTAVAPGGTNSALGAHLE